MKNYKLKDEYQGLIITKKVYGIGDITFDPTKVEPKDYENYIKIGFEQLFEEIVDTVIDFIVDEIKEVIEDFKEKKQRKRKTPKIGGI
jgi:hypothetical protein